MKHILGSLLIGLSLVAGGAQAEVAKIYYGIGVADGTVESDAGEETSLGTLNLTLGFQLLDFLGAEVEVGAASDQTDSLLSDPQLQYQAALLRLGYRWDRIAVYALAGQARLDIDADLNDSDSGNVMGAGINLFGNDTTALSIRVLRFDEGAFTTATIGFQYYFGGFR